MCSVGGSGRVEVMDTNQSKRQGLAMSGVVGVGPPGIPGSLVTCPEPSTQVRSARDGT